MDLLADRDLDIEGPRAEVRHNPLADGALSPRTGLAFSTGFIVLSLVLTLVVAPGALLPWGIILAVIVALALRLLETPLSRAFSLGLPQGLYVFMGGASGPLNAGLVLLAGMFFFAMFGGRGMIDIRDFPQDEAGRVATLPKRYGVRRTAQFAAAGLLVASALGLATYFTGEFGPIYLYLDLAFIAVVSVCAFLFAARPSPRLAYALTLVFMMGAGFLISLAMVLGSI